MIYIVSGTSRSGKSTAAKQIAKELQISYLPTDTIMMGFQNGMPDIGVHHHMFSYEIAKILWPFLRNMIISMIENDLDYIFDGEAFLVEDVRSLIDEYPMTVKACYMGYTNITLDKKYNQIMTYSPKNDWLISFENDVILEHITNMIELSKQIKEECQEFKIPYFDSSINFEETIQKVVGFICNNKQ